MIRVRPLGFAVLATACALAGCSLDSERGGEPFRQSTEDVAATMDTIPASCPEPTELVYAKPFDPYPVARIGPLWFTGVGAGPRAAVLLVPGFPTKVPITAVQGPLKSSLTLEGKRCGGGEPLHFWYRGLAPYADEAPFRIPMSLPSMRGSGDATASLNSGPNSWSFDGYMLFSVSGLWQIEVRSGKTHVGTLAVEVVSGSEQPAAEEWAPVPMMSVPADVLQKCHRSSVLRPACPLRIPSMPRVGASARDGEAPIFNLERSGEDPLRPERNRPPRMLHTLLYRPENGVVPFSLPTAGTARPTNGMVRLGRVDPVFLGRSQWADKDGTLVLAPPYNYGGMAGNHLIFSWDQGGQSYSLSLHAWEPFLETIATLRAMVESIPRDDA